MDIDTLLREHFGFDTFRPGQRDVIKALLDNGAALAVFPTGAGKSLCYQLPAIALDGLTVVVSPLIALMKDQIDFLKQRGINADRLDSSQSADDYREILARIEGGTLKLLYVSPERFNNERFLRLMKDTKIALFAVDEAHCISEWGHNFRPDYLKIAAAARDAGAERVLALTATATPDVVADICREFKIDQHGSIVTGFYRHNLQLATTPVKASDRDSLLLSRLRSRKAGSGIVYVTLQKTAERVSSLLTRAGVETRAYHAGMESEDRHAVQEWWMESPSRIVVATIAFGMGIDKADVRYVYHYNMPKSLESYSQEIGRAGRDNLPSIVEMFACSDDLPTLRNFAYGDTPTVESIAGLVHEILGSGDEFAVSLYDLSARHDIRQLVLRTMLTYLELLGVIRQGTPFYDGYEFRPLRDIDEIVAEFQGEPAQLVHALFTKTRMGKKWRTLNPGEFADGIGTRRGRVVKALDILESRAWIECRVSDLRHKFYREPGEHNADALIAELTARNERREQQEDLRLQQVIDLVTHSGCQTNLLVAHFGEVRSEPCGHCTYCRTGKAQSLPPSEHSVDVPGPVSAASFAALRSNHPAALSGPRQCARFLCGLSSPALTRAKLTRHELFGVLEGAPFLAVLDWASRLEPVATT